MCEYGSSVFPPLLTVGGRWRAQSAHRTVLFSYWGWRRCRSAPCRSPRWRSRRSGSTGWRSGPVEAAPEELPGKSSVKTPSFVLTFETCDQVTYLGRWRRWHYRWPEPRHPHTDRGWGASLHPVYSFRTGSGCSSAAPWSHTRRDSPWLKHKHNPSEKDSPNTLFLPRVW